MVRRWSALRLECLEDRAVPATFNVTTTLDVVDPADGKRSFREAVNAANARVGADVIVLPTGVYQLALAGANENGNATGDFDISDEVTIRGAGAAVTIIDGQDLDRVLDILGPAPASIKVEIEGLAIRNGNTPDLGGGGINFGNANLVLRDCAILDNRAGGNGGGISNGSAIGTGTLTIVRTTVARNIAGDSGGGILVMGGSALTVRNSTIRSNEAATFGGGIRASMLELTSSVLVGNSSEFDGGGALVGTATIIGSSIRGNQSGDDGGGLWVVGMATVTDSTFDGNIAVGGGGGLQADTAVVIGSTFTENSARTGGGISTVSNATVTRCTLNGNLSTEFGRGGGLFSENSATLTNSVISGNTAVSGGGGVATFGAATLTGCAVRGNETGGNGGGINAVSLTLTNSTVSKNSAGRVGGGIVADSADLRNCTISGNTSLLEGGGFYSITAGTILNCTVVKNRGQDGGGLYHGPEGILSVRNSLIALNSVGLEGTGPNIAGVFVSAGHNLIGDGAGGIGFTQGVIGDIVGTSAKPIDPKIGPLADNGGRTKTHALLAGSRAIDRGDNAGVPGTDQRGGGFARNKDGNGDGRTIVDIGAFER
jgi:hypothetical protein